MGQYIEYERLHFDASKKVSKLKSSGMAVRSVLQVFAGLLKVAGPDCCVDCPAVLIVKLQAYGSVPLDAVDLEEGKKLIEADKKRLKTRRKALKATVQGVPLPTACAGMKIKAETAGSELVKVHLPPC